MSRDLPPAFLLEVFRELQRRRFGLGYADLLALRSALRAGFGLRSDRELVDLCTTLWAKEPGEAAVVRAVFARHAPPSWDLAVDPRPVPDGPVTTPAPSPPPRPPEPPAPVPAPPGPAGSGGGLPPLPLLETAGRRIVLDPQYPLTRRAIAQAFRRLRRPVPWGPPTQLDVAATVARRSRSGVVTPPVLVPRRRNLARLLLLVDRKGSMAPFHPYVDHLRDAITEDGGLAHVEVAYFHDTPLERADPRLLRRLRGPFPQIDPVLDAVTPSLAGLVFADPSLLEPLPLADVVERAGDEAAVVVVSDAGAARAGLDPARTLASVAFARALRTGRHRVAWLDPMPRASWAGTSAAQLARHVPVLPLDAAGLHRAVDVLRGRPITLERAA